MKSVALGVQLDMADLKKKIDSLKTSEGKKKFVSYL
jgi:hypothetical protein